MALSYTRSSARLKLATVAFWPTRRWTAASYTHCSMRQVDTMMPSNGRNVGMVGCLRKGRLDNQEGSVLLAEPESLHAVMQGQLL